MGFVEDVRSQLWWSLGSLAVVFGAYGLYDPRIGAQDTPERRADVVRLDRSITDATALRELLAEAGGYRLPARCSAGERQLRH